MYEVDVKYIPPPQGEQEEDDSDDEQVTSALVSHACSVLYDCIVDVKEEGDVLIFLPGKAEIEACVALIQKREKERACGTSRSFALPGDDDEYLKLGRTRQRITTLREHVQSKLADLTKKLKECGRQKSRLSKLNKEKNKLQREHAHLTNEYKELQHKESIHERNRKNKQKLWANKRKLYRAADGTCYEQVDAYPLYGSIGTMQPTQSTAVKARTSTCAR